MNAHLKIMASKFSLTAIQVLVIFVFWGQIQNYMMRSNINILIVAMVEEKVSKNGYENLTCWDNRVSQVSDVRQSENKESVESVKFDWGPFKQGQVLAAFSYGYVATQLIGGRLSERIGFKKVYGGGLFLVGVLTFLLPVAAKIDAYAFMVVRILQGILEGVSFPALHAMTARWIPPGSRNTFIAGTYFGTTFGTMITFPMCGAIVADYGWEAAFYVIGSITVVWFIFWCIFVFDNPDSHPRISLEEKNYITDALNENVNTKEHIPVPWKSIMTSVPFIGLMLADFSNTWGKNTLFTNGPTYMKTVQGVDIKKNGLLSGLPFLLRYFGGIFLCKIADIVIEKKLLSLTNVRRIFNSIALIPPAIALIMIGFASGGLECDYSYVIAILCVGMFFNGAFSAGMFSSHLDLAPNFAGTLMGISNTFAGGVTGFVVPTVIGAIRELDDYDLFSRWKIIFLSAAFIYLFGNTCYIVMISGEVQAWNFGPQGQDGNVKKEMNDEGDRKQLEEEEKGLMA